MNNIGDKMNISTTEPLKLEDGDLVKNKLDVARSHHRINNRHGDRSVSAFGPMV